MPSKTYEDRPAEVEKALDGIRVVVHGTKRLRATVEALSEPTGFSWERVAWLRDMDGTGSLHPCAAGDPGSFPVYAHNLIQSKES